MKRVAVCCAAASWLIGLIGAGDAQAAVQWSDNGHWYAAVPQSLTWAEAAAAAASILPSGHLVTITSQAENDFVTGLITTAFTVGALQQGWWIGGLQNPANPGYSEPAGGWEWVTAEALAFTNWLPGEPNDAFGDGDENRMTLLSGSYAFADRGYWNDLWATHHPEGYIVESTTAPLATPLPGAMFLFAPALAALAGFARRRQA
jgi:hypothetical protein